ncbi:Sec-independent protein translocase subunit TatA [Pseudonocardia sp. NPDC049635]|uniref:Sec-independent protein translocase subunit TatA n=1 Tax=Pseudonocardia sp. NPDC049635 TaxID=3155506 RepID=UPI0033C7093B
MPGGYEWLIIIAVLLLLFGAKKLPEMARSVGQSARVFKGEMKGLKDDDARAKGTDTTVGTEQAVKPAPQELPAAASAPQNQGEPAPQPQERGAGSAN